VGGGILSYGSPGSPSSVLDSHVARVSVNFFTGLSPYNPYKNEFAFGRWNDGTTAAVASSAHGAVEGYLSLTAFCESNNYRTVNISPEITAISNKEKAILLSLVRLAKYSVNMLCVVLATFIVQTRRCH
jgi:hypothetical protein